MIHDIINGLWSGIPLCCILFFLKGNRALETARKRDDIKFENDIGYIPYHDVEYVQCDKCWDSKNDRTLRKGIITWNGYSLIRSLFNGH